MLAGQGKKKLGTLAGRRRRNLRILFTIWAAGTVALLVGGAFALSDFRSGEAAAAIAPAPAPVTATPQVAPVPADAPAPAGPALAAALAPALGNAGLGNFTGSITDAATGTVLWSKDPARPMIPASTTKVLTAAAALLALPAEHRVTTKVVEGSRPGEIVLVAGGDPTLTARPLGESGFYAGAPRIADLVQQIQRSGTAVDTVLVDTGAYAGDSLATGWFPADIAGGSVAPIEPVMLDGGRLNPLEDESPRTPTPALDAGRALAAALGADPARVAPGTVRPGAAPLAAVQSAPLRDRLGQMMSYSDNVLAEAVGRELAAAEGVEPSFRGAVDSVSTVLREAGFDLTGLTLHDVSGLSVDNRIPARLLDAVMAAAAGTEEASLRPMLDYLPVAGATGTLSERYASTNRDGAGWVRAKTGTLSQASGLTGFVVDTDGRVLTFALLSNDRPPGESRPALDAVAATLRGCGCR
ncbi:D-alanyl-D-alanine carboxypeptidase/D-alanyl-D-alanine endopeptidase [Rhodococcus rhodochrous]|uniref:D-alanyl-D-alanine carboxypeptidase n=2 Tax=Rhodococcus TaxID=1827 RepID=A0A0M8PLL4_RHORH|nr:D-alanyl-D-alanine carboxypeptidase/D-alanyl-D-alanine-endopeptidase [Rhodococcus rhodochrous]KOS57425.1 D-alanyl-D-alanine carboxypeptidase [Rhodococcus rhodochrous KG-21]